MHRPVSLVFTIAAFATALVPATAHAWGEVGTRPIGRGGVATCLRDTGQPGVLTVAGALKARSSPVDLLSSTPDLAPVGAADVGILDSCAAVARGQDGTDLVAGIVRRGLRKYDIVATVRHPGSPFAVPTVLKRDVHLEHQHIAAAVAPNGDMLIVWGEERGSRLAGDHASNRLVGTIAAAAEGFAPPKAITPWILGSVYYGADPVVAVDPQDRFTLAWQQSDVDPRKTVEEEDFQRIAVATADTTHGFAPVQVIERPVMHTDLQLAVAPDGDALLVYVDLDEGVKLVERPPGATSFGAAVRLANDVGLPREPAVAVRDGGGAVVAWRTGDADDSGVGAVVRGERGRFGSPIAVSPTHPSAGFLTGESLVAVFGMGGPFPPIDEQNTRLRAQLSGDRVTLAWIAPKRLPGGDRPDVPHAAIGSLSGKFGRATTMESPCRPANGIATVHLRDGEPGVAWTDNWTREGFGPLLFPRGSGSVHLATAAASPPKRSPLPRVRLSSSPQRLFPTQAVKVHAHCDRACELRATMPRPGVYGIDVAASARLTRAGSVELKLAPPETGAHYDRRSVRPVYVHGCGPGGNSVASASTRVRVSTRDPLPTPEPIAARAKRRMHSIVVSWRTTFPARRTTFDVFAMRGRDDLAFEPRSSKRVEGRAKTRFRVVLTPRSIRTVTAIRIQASSVDTEEFRHATVRLRRS
jgi:hypothetical protein